MCTLRVTLIFICDIISNGNATLIEFNNSMPTPDRRIRQDHGNRRFTLKLQNILKRRDAEKKDKELYSKSDEADEITYRFRSNSYLVQS